MKGRTEGQILKYKEGTEVGKWLMEGRQFSGSQDKIISRKKEEKEMVKKN